MAGRFKWKAQLLSGTDIAIGPGKADLLEAIAETGSISAAARKLGMSYRRGWLLVDVMNRCWSAPLVDTVVGGRKGAALSDLGREVLADYRSLEAAMQRIELDPAAGRLRQALGGDKPD